jgi:hypothetical protein
MLKIVHRINRAEDLRKIPEEYGVEVDVRGYGNRLLLNHDPIDTPHKYDGLDDYLQGYHHQFIIFNIKEAGYEEQVIRTAKDKGIENYFLLDVEFPFLYRATRRDGFRKIAVRYSEAEPIEFVEAQKRGNVPLLDWVWIDTNTRLPLDRNIVDRLNGFKTCLVCPDRWGRPEDIEPYFRAMRNLNFMPDAVMTSLDHVGLWERLERDVR